MHSNYIQLKEAQERTKREREQHRASLRQAQGDLNMSNRNDYAATKNRSD